MFPKALNAAARFRRWRGGNTPFAVVTSFAALVVAASSLLDAWTPSGGGLEKRWTWVWTVLAVLVSVIPFCLGKRFHRSVAYLGAVLFVLVTAWQMKEAEASVIAVNNLVLYPMLACYLGWFFRRWTARATVLAAFSLSGTALASNPYDGLAVTWFNLGLASLFCLEAAGYLRRKLDHEINTDPLTGALNRAGLRSRIEQALAKKDRAGGDLTLTLLDVDDFKLHNDSHGHAAGDLVLRELVRQARTVLRPTDVIMRVGGDEFMILLPGTTAATAVAVLDRIKQLTGDTWSYGLAIAGSADDATTLTERADTDLYLNKRIRKELRLGQQTGASTDD